MCCDFDFVMGYPLSSEEPGFFSFDVIFSFPLFVSFFLHFCFNSQIISVLPYFACPVPLSVVCGVGTLSTLLNRRTTSSDPLSNAVARHGFDVLILPLYGVERRRVCVVRNPLSAHRQLACSFHLFCEDIWFLDQVIQTFLSLPSSSNHWHFCTGTASGSRLVHLNDVWSVCGRHRCLVRAACDWRHTHCGFISHFVQFITRATCARRVIRA